MSYNNFQDPPQVTGGNITARLSNALPTAVMSVGGLFEISMPANTDVQIRALIARQVYILSEGEYPGGSFATSTAAIVNLTTAFLPADNNVHVAGERNTITIQDVLTSRIFKIVAWRFGAIAGNWSGWVEEIGATTNQVLTAASPIDITSNQVSFIAPYVRATGSIAIGDFNSATVSANAANTPGVTASIVSGSGGSMIMQVNIPGGLLPDALWKLSGTISSNAAEAAAANASVVWELANKTAIGFQIIFRETISAAQNCNFEFFIIR
jgi:hypothetical protein